MRKLFLNKNTIKNGYLWFFSNEIANINDYSQGEIVNIYKKNNDFICTGYVNPHSLIAARVLSFKDELIDETFFINRFKKALFLREQLYKLPFYRLIYSESDFLPGLVIDRYDNTFSIQINTAGMENLKPMIECALKNLFENPILIYKNDSHSRVLENLTEQGLSSENTSSLQCIVIENDIKIKVDITGGQKRGYFYDQRNNRKILQNISKDKYVLDLFSYTGSFGLNALAGGAKKVDFVDTSANALELARENVLLNNFDISKCNFYNKEAVSFLKDLEKSQIKPDIIIVDPPAYTKSKKLVKQAIEGYINLNKWAFKTIKRDGFILAFSCSHHIFEDTFTNAIKKAAASAAKSRYVILQRLYQSYDHPINPEMEETKYLKGVFLFVY
jgi:23S rRNA (cytosine1962-C5)-methyltransferase